MIYLYDKAITELLRKYFENVVKVDEDELGATTKKIDMKYKNIDPPYITIKRESCEFSTTGSDEGGLNAKPLIMARAGVLLNRTRQYNKEDIKKAVSNGVLLDNMGYNYYSQPIPINLKYKIEVLADNLENLDNIFSDVIYVLLTDNKLILDPILSKKFTDNEFYTFVEVEEASFIVPRDKELGVRYAYEIRVSISGAKLYYTKKDKVVIKLPIEYQANK